MKAHHKNTIKSIIENNITIIDVSPNEANNFGTNTSIHLDFTK